MITFRGLQAFFQELYHSLVLTNITARYYECPRRDLVPRSFSSSISARTRAETTLVPHFTSLRSLPFSLRPSFPFISAKNKNKKEEKKKRETHRLLKIGVWVRSRVNNWPFLSRTIRTTLSCVKIKICLWF